MHINVLKLYLKERVKQSKEMVEVKKLSQSDDLAESWEGWYWEGRLSAYEDIYDLLVSEEDDLK